ncbi:chymotrypsin-2-like [Cydia splendana]|uniref:chymotrypsin-2-like n=1 Tax=Cydia splendana TaxID=1100963 RepID=UPI00300C9872
MVELTVDAIPSKDSLREYAGEDTRDQFPFAVVLWYLKTNLRFCTGSLLNYNWVLTSADCVENQTPRGIAIKYGDYTTRESTKIAKVNQVFIHPSFCRAHGLNDIALLFTEKVNGISTYGKLLALDYKALFGLPVTYAGFGRISKEHSDILDEQLLPLQVGRGVVIPCESSEFKYGALCIAPRCKEVQQKSRSEEAGGPLLYRGRIVGVETSVMTKRNLANRAIITHFVTRILRWGSNAECNEATHTIVSPTLT